MVGHSPSRRTVAAAETQSSRRERTVTPPVDAFALPAAMNRLARAHGVGVDASDAAISEEYGTAPKRESLKILANELGADFAPRRGELGKIPAETFPLVAMTRRGGAIILHRRDRDTIFLERPSGPSRATVLELREELLDVFFAFRLNGQSAERMTGAGRIEPTKAASRSGRLLLDLYAMLIRRHRSEMLQLVAAAMIINLFMMALPLYIMSVYDRVIPHAAFESLIALTIGAGIVLAADLGLRHVKLKFIDAVGMKSSRALQTRLYRKLLFSSLANRPRSAAQIAQAQQDVDGLCLQAPEFLASLVADTALAISILTLIYVIGGAIVIAPIIGCAIVAISVFIGAASAREPSKRSAALRNAAAAQVAETFESLTSIKANTAEHALLNQFERLADAASLIGHDARQRSRFVGHSTSVIVQATVVGTLFLGVVRIDQGAMSIGALAATTILVGRAVTPISQLVDQFNRIWTLKEVLAPALDSVAEQEEKGGERDGGESRTVSGSIAFRRVSFRHGDDVVALSDISLDIEPGEKIALIGKNGSGKSTLLHLIPRLYEPTSGSILIDGHDARQFSARRLRQAVALMPQETVLLNAPLKDNILLGASGVSEDDFRRAVEAAGVDKFARRHPKGYSLEVGPRGEFLSAGERQAVGLARTILKPRKILLLDEPTSMMDHTAESDVIEALRRETAGRTLILTTHRLRLLEIVDRVIVLDGGRVVADGPRDAVLKQLAQPTPAVNRRAASVA
ncbi:MAG: ATP-binding cassette domain-containing protein [Alphaproteobacteria bacterium]|nr:ATP-binding cassette domain-containing protein [Alphaproteobacteria bacterium]